MKKTTVLLIFSIVFSSTSFSQIVMKLKFPKCEVTSDAVFADVNNFKTFVIKTQEEFDKYFKITDGTTINFEKNMVLAGLIGKGKNEDKFIEINAAAYDPKGKYLNVRYDFKEEKLEDNGKFALAVVPKSFDYKKVAFLKGKMYNWSQSGE